MTLSEKFESSGNWLFRWRSYLPLILFVIFLLEMRNYSYLGGSENIDRIWEMVCMLISFFGLAIRIITIGYVPKGTSGRNTKKQVADTLNTTGIYSIVRNPLYLGNFFMGLGIAMFAHVWWLAVIYILAFWVYYERIIFAEEAYLKGKFGEEFIEWAGKTPAIVPRFNNYRKPDMVFSARNVLRREYGGFFTIIVTLFILELAGDYSVEGRFVFDKVWLSILTVGIIVWMTLRTMKKYTKILDVEGR